MSKEHITSHAMHLWDMRMIEYFRTGQAQRILDEMPEFTEQAIAESDGGGLSWLLSTLDTPTYPATLHGYGTIIGTGNAIVEWPERNHTEGSQ
jgi:2-aminophenol/2-amino-5-chlorophenol 1,6-dioxygenase beta subunit